MRFKLLKPFFVSALLIAPIFSANAIPTVTPAAPFSIVKAPSGNSGVYYPSTNLPTVPGTPAPNGYYIGGAGYTQYDFTSDNTDLQFTVSGVSANLMVYAQDKTNSTIYYPVSIKEVNGTTYAQNTLNYVSMGGLTYTIGINPKWICNTLTTASGPSTRGCTAGSLVDEVTNPIPGLFLSFIDTAATDTTVPTPTERGAGAIIEVFPELKGPTITHCPADPFFVPDDGAILVNTADFTATANTTTGGSPTFTFVQLAASTSAITNTDYTTADLIPSAAFGIGESRFPGFTNSTSAAQTFYFADYGVQDSAGVLAFCGQNPGGVNPITGYPISNVFATDIKGFLRESNCFVATASFRSGRAPAVMMLRKFRDEVLSKYDLGRDFIGWYYANGPIAADWLIDHPVFRTVALSALLPLQVLAWTALHPKVLWIPFTLLILFGLFFLPRRWRSLPYIAILALVGSQSARAASNQPYIDSLVSDLPKESYQHTSGNPDPYIQKLKKEVKQDDSQGYTEELRKDVSRDHSAGYTDRIQKGLPADNRSAIDDYKHGRKLKPNKGDLTTASAFGFQIAVTANRTYTAGANQDVAYDEVYGSGWIPDFKVHYESRPFSHSGVFGKLGLYGSVGSSFTHANGVYDYNPDPAKYGARSRTEFKFIMIPVNAGLVYRMNWGVLFPYFGGGPSAIGFIEKRNDSQPNQKGHDFGYWFMGGVALGLDWMSPASSWGQYDSAGIKHSYLAIEYSYLTSFPGGLVDMTVDGVQVGFTFEL